MMRFINSHASSATFEVAEHVGDGVIAVSAAGQVTALTRLREPVGRDRQRQPDRTALRSTRTTLTGSTAAAQYVEIVDLPASAAERGDGYSDILLDRRDRARLARLRSDSLACWPTRCNPLTSMVTA